MAILYHSIVVFGYLAHIPFPNKHSKKQDMES